MWRKFPAKKTNVSSYICWTTVSKMSSCDSKCLAEYWSSARHFVWHIRNIFRNTVLHSIGGVLRDRYLVWNLQVSLWPNSKKNQWGVLYNVIAYGCILCYVNWVGSPSLSTLNHAATTREGVRHDNEHGDVWIFFSTKGHERGTKLSLWTIKGSRNKTQHRKGNCLTKGYLESKTMYIMHL